MIEFLKEGDIYFVGARKSGIVASLLSSYFRSVGVKSYVIHPTDALHGEMSFLTSKDKCICISHTGETREIIDFVNQAKKKRV